jgi:ribA/ribD-fused uncharacterized protein
MDKITSFTGGYRFLSNFYPATIQLEETYSTAEHAYQACKTLDRELRKKVASLRTPGQAKRFGKTIPLRSDWERIKVGVMKSILILKFDNPKLGKMLLSTGDSILIEGNNWGDTFWGCVWNGQAWKGKNYLGKILMEIRNMLRYPNG